MLLNDLDNAVRNTKGLRIDENGSRNYTLKFINVPKNLNHDDLQAYKQLQLLEFYKRYEKNVVSKKEAYQVAGSVWWKGVGKSFSFEVKGDTIRAFTVQKAYGDSHGAKISSEPSQSGYSQDDGRPSSALVEVHNALQEKYGKKYKIVCEEYYD